MPLTEPSRPAVILILDDSPIDREVFRRFLSSDPRREYRIHESADIEEALELCTDLKPDCILLDHSLGDGTGLDFLRLLPQIGGTQLFPVVMLTGSGNEQIAANAFKSGAQDYLSKVNLSADALQRAVAGAIYKASAERQLNAQRVELERLYREAQEANARKDQFLAALSHELRTPLSPILTTVSAINVAETSKEELEQLFALIRRNVELEARLIDDLLDLTRIAKGKLWLDLHSVDVHEVIRHALANCSSDIEVKQLHVDVSLSASGFIVRADAARLQQVFWNLLKNAVKFTPSGGWIRITTSNPEQGTLIVQVADSGIGIRAETISKIFDAFEQGSADMTHRFGGLGLGLAISKAVIDAHGGALRVESAGEGKGSTFSVTLKTTEQAPDLRSRKSPEEPSMGVDERNRGESRGHRILLVEDHPDSSRVLSRVLSRHGYFVVTAASVKEALGTFSREPVDIVLCDIGLPDGSGLDLMKRISDERAVPGIALSGYGMEHDLERSRAAGFEEHLTKPVDWAQLEAALSRILADHNDSRQ